MSSTSVPFSTSTTLQYAVTLTSSSISILCGSAVCSTSRYQRNATVTRRQLRAGHGSRPPKAQWRHHTLLFCFVIHFLELFSFITYGELFICQHAQGLFKLVTARRIFATCRIPVQLVTDVFIIRQLSNCWDGRPWRSDSLKFSKSNAPPPGWSPFPWPDPDSMYTK